MIALLMMCTAFTCSQKKLLRVPLEDPATLKYFLTSSKIPDANFLMHLTESKPLLLPELLSCIANTDQRVSCIVGALFLGNDALEYCWKHCNPNEVLDAIEKYSIEKELREQRQSIPSLDSMEKYSIEKEFSEQWQRVPVVDNAYTFLSSSLQGILLASGSTKRKVADDLKVTWNLIFRERRKHGAELLIQLFSTPKELLLCAIAMIDNEALLNNFIAKIAKAESLEQLPANYLIDLPFLLQMAELPIFACRILLELGCPVNCNVTRYNATQYNLIAQYANMHSATPLRWVISSTGLEPLNVPLVRLLLQHGAVLSRGIPCQNLFYEICESRHSFVSQDLVELLLCCGMDPFEQKQRMSPAEKLLFNRDSKTPGTGDLSLQTKDSLLLLLAAGLDIQVLPLLTTVFILFPTFPSFDVILKSFKVNNTYLFSNTAGMR